MVKALRKLPEKPKVEVGWDLETDGFSDRVLAACAVTSDGKRIAERNLAAFVKSLRSAGLLRRKPGEVRFWAHYGGTFDVLVCLRWFLANGWRIEGGKAGAAGSFWAVDLVSGRDRIELRDSARLFQDSLKKLGKAFGLEKLDVDRGNIGQLSWEETREYCLRDCEIVLLAVQKFSEFVEREGATMADTIAGCASRVVRARCVPPDAWGWTIDTDECGARAYYGGRVERFRERAPAGQVFDVNSMYPWSMTNPLPGRFIGTGTGKPPTGNVHVILDCTVHVPRGTFVGPLPHRPTTGALKGRLTFPTGTFRGIWAMPELQAAEETINWGYWKKVHRWYAWDSEPWLSELITSWYERRKAASTETEKYMLKLLLNSVSGKLIERADYESLTSIAKVAREAEKDGAGIALYPTRDGVVYGMREMRVGTLRHGAAAAWVLSLARAKLYRALFKFWDKGRLDYCDTDSVFGDGTPDDVDASRLGAWKPETRYSSAEFLAPKLYALESESGLLVKCKGWPKTVKGLDGEEKKLEPRELWETIRSRSAVTGERTRLIKSQLRKGRIEFARDTMTRKRGYSIDKRCFEGSVSRPWDISELPGLRENTNEHRSDSRPDSEPDR